ncbi:hypothetical protein CLHUN_36940 [Ruminiclostridium hungatei]|uniref:Uncharacterized protein n=1 Tax=Ruminiclostridium hungatei TaxID=48256 RepID=A0A1V4SGJ9_RUMHU|nr:hypothetical protein CLHUN_36940 [Ruminiclostridium hungatei]
MRLVQHSINRVHKFGRDFLEIQGGGVRNNCFIPMDDNDVVQKNIPNYVPGFTECRTKA